MNKQLSYNGCEAAHCAASGPRDCDGEIWNVTPWRAALDTLLGVPLRLHRYRHLRAEAIDDALRAFGGGANRGDRP